MKDVFLTLEGVSVQIGGAMLLDSLDLAIRRGEQWAITGPSGSGKTLLAHTLLGKHFYTGKIQYYFDGQQQEGAGSPRVAIVEQQHRFRNLPGATELYYQQRFNASDADKTITVEQELAEYAGWEEVKDRVTAGAGAEGMRAARGEEEGQTRVDWLELLQVRPLLTKPLIQLSNGENKRVQLAIALLGQPELLVLDNPFLGLDRTGRDTLHHIIDELAGRGLLTLLILITGVAELPASVTHVAQLEQGKWVFRGKKSDLPVAKKEGRTSLLNRDILKKLGTIARQEETEDFAVAVKMAGVTVRYGETTILDRIDWEVKKGERWSLSGPNGAGKSTILSLITADNPQAYANDIWLFDRKRGTGESIWDIKRKIGFVSPELHLYFDHSANSHDVIASGLFDTIGLFRVLTEEQEERVRWWMQLLSLEGLRSKRLTELSTGQQRMVLLARALIKNPPMLILDEPCQGLDDAQTADFRELIRVLCETLDTTLVYVSHYQQEWPACIDHFIRLDKGRVL